MIRTLTRTGILAALLLPGFAFAAYNDVQLTTDASIQVDSNTLTVTSDSNAVLETLKINGDGTFTVTLVAGSEISFSSADRKTLTVTGAPADRVTFVCNSSTSRLTIHSNPTGFTATTTIGSTCSGSGSGGIVSSGGGGGSTGVVTVITPAATTQVATPAATQVPTVPAPGTTQGASNPAVSKGLYNALNRLLVIGNSGNDVKVLQQMLNQDPATQVSSSGAGSPGSETTTMGPATVAALKKFQEKHGIANPGDVGYGNLGPKTRAKLNELYASGTPSVSAPASSSSAAVSGKLTIPLKVGSTGAEVKLVQQMLNKDSATQVSVSGAGSPGNETELYGPATTAAVKKFQEKWGIAAPGDEGYGNLGPKTRAKLNELYGN